MQSGPAASPATGEPSRRSSAARDHPDGVDESPSGAASPGYRLLALTEEELQRLVLDVHDGPVQYLFAALGQLAGLRARVAADGAPSAYVAALARASECVEAALADIRRTVSAFRAPVVAQRGLSGVVEELVVGHEARTGSRVDLTVEGELPLVPLAVTITLYRIVQEALSNVERHAGVAQAAVRLWAAPGSVGAEISDGGRGFDPPPLVGPDATDLPAHIGLRGMRERVALVGGRLSVESRPGGGTRVRAEVPIGD